MKHMKMKLLLSILIFPILIIFNGCNFGTENTFVYRLQVTIETNLSKLRIGNTYLDSTNVYPYVLEETTETISPSSGFIIYPVKDSGIINLKVFGGKEAATPL